MTDAILPDSTNSPAASLTSEPEKLLPEGIALEHVTPTIAAAFADNACLIYSGEHRLYWRANAHGYTSEATRAGRYTIGEAYERTRHCAPDKQIRFVRLSSPVSGTDMVMVRRDALAAGCYVLRRYVPDSKTLAELSAASLSASSFTPIPVIAEAGEREIEAAARYVLANSRRGTSTNAEQFDADTTKLMAAYRDIIGKAVASGFLSTPATLDNTAVEGLRASVRGIRKTFERIAARHPKDQPAYPDGGRQWANGDLQHCIDTLLTVEATITAKTERRDV